MPSRRERARRGLIRVLTIARRSRRRRAGHHKLFVIALSLLAALSIGGGAEAFDRYHSYTQDLPDPKSLSARELAQSTKIYDRNGQLLYVKHTEGVIRTVVPLSDISPHLIQATIALEDRQFYVHHGIDLRRIVGAAVADVTHQRAQQGGSTITQQLVKSIFLGNERSLERKIREAALALEIERRFSKNEILTIYLNQIFYGHEAYGVEAAAQTYYAKPAKDLSIAQAAMLAGLPNAPSDLDPLNPQTAQYAKDRQALVLRGMLRDNYISEAEYQSALKEELKYENGTIQRDVKAPWFVDYVLKVLGRQYGDDVVKAGGLSVITTLDYGLQMIAEQAVAAEVNNPDMRARRVNNGAAEVLDPNTGQVLAMVGSANYYDQGIGGQYNFITEDSGRQPGSSFKIYVYATAFSNGYSPGQVINDQEGKIAGQPFHNWDNRSEGLITLRKAFYESRNIPAIKLLQQLGYERVFQTAKMMGLNSSTLTPERGLSQAIGASEVVPMEHFNAFGVLASGGIRHDPVVILKVTDSQGRVLQEWKPSPGIRVLSPQVAYLMNDVLKPVGQPLRINRPFSAKSGTTEFWRDAWFIGYNPEIVIGAWMGHTCAGGCPAGSDNLNVVWGTFGAGYIFRDIFNAYEASHPARDFQMVDGLKRLNVCRQSGLLATPVCGAIGDFVNDLFIAGFEPNRDDDWYRQVRVCTTDGLLATLDMPAELTTLKTYVFYPPGYPDDMKQKDNPQPPTQACGLFTETTPPTLTVTQAAQADGSVLLTADARDDQAIKEVDFYLDPQPDPAPMPTPTRVSKAPYTFSVTGKPGSIHTVVVQAYDFNTANGPAVQTVKVTLPGGGPPPAPSPGP